MIFALAFSPAMGESWRGAFPGLRKENFQKAIYGSSRIPEKYIVHLDHFMEKKEINNDFAAISKTVIC